VQRRLFRENAKELLIQKLDLPRITETLELTARNIEQAAPRIFKKLLRREAEIVSAAPIHVIAVAATAAIA